MIAKTPTALWIAASLLAVMAILMIGPARQDSATVDETTALGTGYTYWTGHRFYFVPEHPPVAQMLPAVPLLFMDLKLSPNAQALLNGTARYPWARPWAGPIRAWQDFFPEGRGMWYFWALPESQLFGQMFVYDGTNDGDAMMLAGRTVQILLALAVGALIFWWIRDSTGDNAAALIAMALWVFNPVSLAYGHLITTDIGVTLGIAGAVLLFAKLLDRPDLARAMAGGAAMGLALTMKLTTIVLGPPLLLLVLLRRRQLRSSGINPWKLAVVFLGTIWLVILLVYFPHWSPPPPLPESQAEALGVPGWFQAFRPFLIPGDFFKALGLTLGHSKVGHENYLLGAWSQEGRWDYFPLAFLLKSPIPFVILTIVCLLAFGKVFRHAPLLEATPWVVATAYLLIAMTSNVNIGVRHLLPIFPLCCVGIGNFVARWSQPLIRKCVYGLLGWQILVTILAYPLYIQFFSEAVGGATNGYKYLIDSNYDWGQDANRLKQFLAEHDIHHIYLDYFGTQYNIEYLKIPNTRVSADEARQLTDGWLVVSASELMRPEWSWLRDSRQPTARVAYTLFVYHLGA
ncbi:MAG TPA: glycosyltransferase family 39 protein [Verrucomicrobiae bacterium]|nr:glycosyltransferase family 39 protein [Verrucomicrobiae bacterium]